MPTQRREKSRYVHSLFGNIARRYDVMNDLMTCGRHRRWRQNAVSVADTLEEGSWGLDLCCGSGDFLAAMLQLTGGKGHFIGVDFSGEMLALARERFSSEIAEGTVELVKADVSDLSFLPVGRFALVTCGFGLRNVENLAGVLVQARERLRMGGALVSLDLTRPAPLLLEPAVWLYLRWIVPLLAVVVARAPTEYRWLHESRVKFPTRDGLRALMEQVGFSRLRLVNYAFGVVAAHIGYVDADLH